MGQVDANQLGHFFGKPLDLSTITLLFFCIAISKQILSVMATFLAESLRWRTTNALRADLVRHCLRLPMSFHTAHSPGEMIARVDHDVNTLSNFFSHFVIQLVGQGFLIFGMIGLLVREDWRLGISFVAFILIATQILNRVTHVAVPYFEAQLARQAQVFGFIEERLACTEDIRANGTAAYTLREFHQQMRQQFFAERKANGFYKFIYNLVQGFFAVGTALGLGLAGYLFQLDLVTIGTVYLILQYSTMLQEPLLLLTDQFQDLQQVIASVARIQALFRHEVEDSLPRGNLPEPYALCGWATEHFPDPWYADPSTSRSAPTIQFQQVDFGYEQHRTILSGISFSLEAGHILGLMGRTGCGKTTITRLLFRLYEAQRGQILLDGQPIDEIPVAELRQRIGLVTQEVQLFQGTVRDNLTFFDPALSDANILAALQRLNLTEWLSSLPNGLDTLLATGEHGMSAGEGQLLALVRVFLQDPGLIILDEASSRLDPITEGLIEGALDQLLQDRTAIIIAHRLSTIQRADQIMILADGAIEEHGNRVDLAQDTTTSFHQLLLREQGQSRTLSREIEVAG